MSTRSPSSRPLAERSFADVLTGVSSANPSPGGGAVGALVVALGIACGLKAVRISRKHNGASKCLAEAEILLVQLSTAVPPLADADGEAFENLLAAYKLPKLSNEEMAARRGAISHAAARAASVGQEINTAATSATTALALAKPDISANIVSDYNAAMTLLHANQSIQDENIEVNSKIAGKFGAT